MIRDIKEINLPSYATLHTATVNMNAMGENTIEAQIKIDGSIVPNFVGTDGKDWTLEFKGEKYVMPLREPQASKSNESINSFIDLTFHSWGQYELKRYYFVELASTQSGTAIADKYVASLGLSLPDFCTALGNVLTYYYGDKISVDLNESAVYNTEPTYFDINYTYIWDVLQSLYETYDVRWRLQFNAESNTYIIKIGYESEELSHIFEYGFNGGLLRFERQVQSSDIRNIVLGRGGNKNLPKLYFKDYEKFPPVAGSTLSNGEFKPDPDAIPELVNIYFDNLRDSNFRDYVRGWKAQKGYDGAVYESGQGWAYEKGYTDTLFQPVEYVKDDDSIAKYGELWGALDNNEDIYPTIQGVSIDPYGRIDEVVAVSEITSDDIDTASASSATITNVAGATFSIRIPKHSFLTKELRGCTFEVPEGKVGILTYQYFVDANNAAITVNTTYSNVKVYAVDTDEEVPATSIPTGKYYYVATIRVYNDTNANEIVTFGVQQMKCSTNTPQEDGWKPTFDIWVKNIWETTKGANETAVEYADRVWIPILGDKEGNSASVVFSTGFLASSSDYEFTVVDYAYDTSKSFNGVQSEWKLTLAKSDAELEATGLYIPNSTTGGNAVAGDKFFFIGCDMPFNYVKWAEKRLNTYKTEEGLNEFSEIKPTWVVTLDKVRTNIVENGVKLIDSIKLGGIVNIRDKRFTGNDTLQLYVDNITYKWSEPSDNAPYIVPDVEITLSDDLVFVKSSVESIANEVSEIKKQYVTADAIQKAVTTIADRQYLKKAGDSDTSYSPTEFASKVTEKDFIEGAIGGKGWGFYKNGDGLSVLEADKLIVRKEMEVNQLVVNQISYVGGKQIISAASIECSQVDEIGLTYVCHFNQKGGSVANLFKVGDVAFGQVYNAEQDNELRYYKMKVVEVGLDSITLSKQFKQGDGVPSVGDIIVQFGSYTDTDRQYAIVRDVIGGGYEVMLSGLDSVESNGKEYYFAGKRNGNDASVFIGQENGDYIEYSNGKVTIKADVELSQGTALYNKIDNIDQQVTNILGGLDNDLVLSPIEKIVLRDSLEKINNSKESTVITGTSKINSNQETTGLYERWELVRSGEYSGYYQSQNHDDDGASINRFGFYCDSQAKLSVVVTVSAEGQFDFAAISAIDGQLTYDGNDFVDAYEEIKAVEGETLVTKVFEFNVAQGQHTIDIGFSKDSSVTQGDDCAYVRLSFGDAYGTLNDWIEYCRSVGKSYIAAIDKANALFGYLHDTCEVWENTDTTFTSTLYLAEIQRLFNEYYSEISVATNALPDFQYLKTALASDNGTTYISGGLTLGTFIGVKNTTGNVVAAMNASDTIGYSTDNGRLMLFAGSESAEKISSANFRVYENGFIYAKDAEIHGSVYADKGTFGGNLIIGTQGGKRLEIQSGNNGAVNIFDTDGNLTTHIGNDYCISLQSFIDSSAPNAPVIPSMNGTSSGAPLYIENIFYGEDDVLEIGRELYRTGHKFNVIGDISANRVKGKMRTVLYITEPSGYVGETLVTSYVKLYVADNTNGERLIDFGECVLANKEVGTLFTKYIDVDVVLPQGEYYLYADLGGDAFYEGGSGTITANVTVYSSTFTVDAIDQRLSVYANGIGYKYSAAQYAVLLRESESYFGSGDLAFTMRTGTSVNRVGLDVKSSGVKILGANRVVLGRTTSTSTTKANPMSDCNEHGFIEIIATFNNIQRRMCLMPLYDWKDSNSTKYIKLGDADSYVGVYYDSDISFKIKESNNLDSVYIIGVL